MQIAAPGGAQLADSNKGCDEKSLILRCFPMTGQWEGIHLNLTEQKKLCVHQKKDLMNANESPDQRAAPNTLIALQTTRKTQMGFFFSVRPTDEEEATRRRHSRRCMSTRLVVSELMCAILNYNIQLME